MRLLDALSALKSGKAKPVHHHELSTIWSEAVSSNDSRSDEIHNDILSEYPRPQFRRDNWTCLNGLWDYTFTKHKERPESVDGQILVPFSPECSRSGVGRRLEPGEYLWYFRTIHLDSIPKGQRLLLHFGAVDHSCSVWWNGKLLGSHQNGYLSFFFDVTDYLKKGSNKLWVRVQDDTDLSCHCRGKQTLQPHGMFYTAQSGIWQTVWMEWVPEKRIESLKITPLYDESAVRLEITLTEPEHLEIQMMQGDDFFCSYVNKRDFSSDSPRIVRDLPLPDFKSWSPEQPYLYDISIITPSDRVQSYFAMRKFSVGTDENGHPRLFLNNQPYFFNGILDQGYWPESLYTPPSDEAMVFDIRQMKKLGFNMLRKHLKIEPMRWYYHCDRLGMIVWQDMINGGGKLFMPFVCYFPTIFPAAAVLIKDHNYRLFSRTSQKGRRQWEEDLMHMIDQLYNCPCIGLWVPFNEGWGQFDALRITEKIRRADDTRLIDHASGWFDQGGGDIKSVHNYFRKLRVKKDRRPFVLSEYGGYSCPVNGHLYCDRSYGYRAYKDTSEFTRAFQRLQQTILDLQKDGLAAAVYTQVSDVEEEINGLMTYDRKILKVNS